MENIVANDAKVEQVYSSSETEPEVQSKEEEVVSALSRTEDQQETISEKLYNKKTYSTVAQR